MEAKTIGSFIRKANGMTQKQLAEKLCVSDKTVSRWERNETTPDLSLIPVIAEIFGVTSDELLRGERRQAAPTSPISDAPTEKQVQHLLSAAKAKHTTRMIFSAAIALLCWIISFFINHSYHYRDASIPILLAGSLIAVVCQIISSVNLFASVHSEDFSGPKSIELKRHILSSTGLLTGGIAAVTAFFFPILNLRVQRSSFSNYDQVEQVVTGAFALFAVLLVWLVLYSLVKYFLSEHDHGYLRD